MGYNYIINNLSTWNECRLIDTDARLKDNFHSIGSDLRYDFIHHIAQTIRPIVRNRSWIFYFGNQSYKSMTSTSRHFSKAKEIFNSKHNIIMDTRPSKLKEERCHSIHTWGFIGIKLKKCYWFYFLLIDPLC